MTESMMDTRWDLAFEELLGRSADELYAEDLACASAVPADFLALGSDLFAPAASSAPAAPVRPAAPAAPVSPAVSASPAASLLTKLIPGALIALLGAAVVTAGVFFIPPIRNTVFPASEAGITARAERAAKDYVIPAPWEGGSVLQEASGEHMAFRWFQKGQYQVIVEIAESLPHGADLSGKAEEITVGGIPGAWYPDAQALLLQDGANYIYIGYWNGEKQALLDYAAAFAAANP